jgi:hypothetical protein
LIIVNIFLVLSWVAFLAVIFFGGVVITIRFGGEADIQGLPLRDVAWGLFLRGFGTIALTAIIAGAPFQLGVF